MKWLPIAIVFSSLILNLHADTFSNEICAKEIWDPEESTAPSSVDDDSDNSNQNSKGNKSWKTTPKPEAEEGNNPSMFAPKAGHEAWYPDGDNSVGRDFRRASNRPVFRLSTSSFFIPIAIAFCSDEDRSFFSSSDSRVEQIAVEHLEVRCVHRDDHARAFAALKFVDRNSIG